MTGIEVRKGRVARCVYCGEQISTLEKRVVIHNGPPQWNYPRSSHIPCFTYHNRLSIAELAYNLHLIDRERLVDIFAINGASYDS